MSLKDFEVTVSEYKASVVKDQKQHQCKMQLLKRYAGLSIITIANAKLEFLRIMTAPEDGLEEAHYFLLCVKAHKLLLDLMSIDQKKHCRSEKKRLCRVI